MTSLPRPGIARIVSPARPAATSTPVARTAAGCVTSTAPATRSGDTNGVHALVPRSTSVSDDHCVVVREDSMKSRNGGLTCDIISSGRIHQAHASTSPNTHQRANHTARIPARRTVSNHHSSATPSAATVATAFTAPISATAAADRNPCRHSGSSPRSSARITGMSTHGASIIGNVSDEIDPSVVSTRGLSTNTVAATIRDAGDPARSASASRTIPTNPTVSSTAHHRRWVIHGGMCARSPAAKNAPCGKK